MPDIDLTQQEADALIQMEKHRANNIAWTFPANGDRLEIPLISANKRENFLLDIRRARIDLAKITYQHRSRQIVRLLRLDLGGPPHRNPDGQEMPCPHLHVYREGFHDKWAFPIDSQKFSDISDRDRALDDFMRLCNVTVRPTIHRNLF